MCMEQGARSLFRHTIYQYSVLCTPVDPWVTTGQSHYSRRTRVHLHYLCIKYAPQASTVTYVIAQRGSDRPISGSPGRKNQKKSTKLCPLMYSCQEFSLVTSSTSLSPSRFALSSSLHLSLSLTTITPFSPTSTSTFFYLLAPFFHSFLLFSAVLESRVVFLFRPIS